MADQLDLIWGCAAIGAFLGISEAQAKYACVKGELPARKCNGRWVASRKALERFFAGEAA